MKRSPLPPRSRPMKRVPLAKSNPARKAALHTAHFGEDGAYCDWLRTQPCACGCGRWERDRIHLHHTKSRGAGGGVRNLVPLMFDCHDAGHVGGWRTFEASRGVDLQMEADRLALRWAAFVAERPTRGLRFQV